MKEKMKTQLRNQNDTDEHTKIGMTNYVSVKNVEKFKNICNHFCIKTKRKLNQYKMILEGDMASLWCCDDLVDEVYLEVNGHINESHKLNTVFDLIYETLEKDQRILFSYFESEFQRNMVISSLTINSNGDKLVNRILIEV